EIGIAATVPMLLLGRPGLGPTDLASLVAFVRDNPGTLRMAHVGVGAATYLCGLLFTRELGLDVEMVAYAAMPDAARDLATGAIDLMCGQTTSPGRTPEGTTLLIEGESVTVFATTGDERLPMLPDVPTVAEAGFPDLAVEIWHGLWAPA